MVRSNRLGAVAEGRHQASAGTQHPGNVGERAVGLWPEVQRVHGYHTVHGVRVQRQGRSVTAQEANPAVADGTGIAPARDGDHRAGDFDPGHSGGLPDELLNTPAGPESDLGDVFLRLRGKQFMGGVVDRSGLGDPDSTEQAADQAAGCRGLARQHCGVAFSGPDYQTRLGRRRYRWGRFRHGW
jgi:hypothetical protein